MVTTSLAITIDQFDFAVQVALWVGVTAALLVIVLILHAFLLTLAWLVSLVNWRIVKRRRHPFYQAHDAHLTRRHRNGSHRQ